MRGKCFVDTNVFVYAIGSNVVRSERALQEIRDGCVTSVQVLNEFANVCRTRLRLDWETIETKLAELRPFIANVRSIDLSTHLLGMALAEKFKLQIYDSLLLASALEARCTTFVSEDMQHGFEIAGLTIVNPFKT
jgi:predicted nucleic acid-binding protein